MSPQVTVLAVPTTPKWLEVPVNVYHTGTDQTVVTTLVIATLSVMAVTAQLQLIVTTVSSMLHGAQDSVPVTTHMQVRNVTTASILRPQPNKSSPNKTTAMMSMVTVTE